MRVIICCCLLVGWLPACSKHDEQKPAAPQPAAPPQLTVAAPAASITANPPQPVAQTNTLKIERVIEVKSAGNLHILFPQSWEDKLTRVPEKGLWFDSIMFRSRGTNEFELMVNVNNVGQASADNLVLKDVLERAGRAELTNSVEKSLEIHEIQGANVTGCYFVVTDKTYNSEHPAKGDFHYLTQGYAKIDGLILSIRLVSNHLAPEQEEMLDMIKTARLEKK